MRISLGRAAILVLGSGILLAAAFPLRARGIRHVKMAHMVPVAKAAGLTAVPPPVMKVEDLPPVVMRKLTPEELTPSLIKKAEDVLWKFDSSPVGSEIMIEDNGKSVIARFEEHFHEIGGPKRPWGLHKGITLYAAE